MIGAFPSKPGLQVKYMDVASVSLTTGVEGGDGSSENTRKKNDTKMIPFKAKKKINNQIKNIMKHILQT